VAHLKISDIDSQRMVIHIRGGNLRRPMLPLPATVSKEVA